MLINADVVANNKPQGTNLHSFRQFQASLSSKVSTIQNNFASFRIMLAAQQLVGGESPGWSRGYGNQELGENMEMGKINLLDSWVARKIIKTG